MPSISNLSAVGAPVEIPLAYFTYRSLVITLMSPRSRSHIHGYTEQNFPNVTFYCLATKPDEYGLIKVQI